jgi:hypothetical protein
MATTLHERSTLHIETGGSIVEVVGGIAVAVLAIISLAEATPSALVLSTAVVVLGIAFVAEGGAIAAEFSRLIGVDAAKGFMPSSDIGAGMTLELVGGIGLVVLGILALIGVATETLIAVAALTGGALVLLSSGAVAEMNEHRFHSTDLSEGGRGLAMASFSGAATIQFLAGAAATVLGILALTGNAPLMFSQIALLVLGSALIMGTSATGTLIRMFAH